jgi:hypothetical protein
MVIQKFTHYCKVLPNLSSIAGDVRSNFLSEIIRTRITHKRGLYGSIDAFEHKLALSRRGPWDTLASEELEGRSAA